MRNQIFNNSINEGKNQSRLPELSSEWIQKIRGSADFLGLNYYTSRIVETLPKPIEKDPSFNYDLRQIFITKPEWKYGGLPWMYSVPHGIGDLLR